MDNFKLPKVFIEHSNWIKNVNRACCFNCKKKFEKLKLCSRCKSIYYCSKKCQNIHLPEHTNDCDYVYVNNQSLCKTIGDLLSGRHISTFSYFCVLFENEIEFNRKMDYLHIYNPLFKNEIEEITEYLIGTFECNSDYMYEHLGIYSTKEMFEIKNNLKKKEMLALFKTRMNLSVEKSQRVVEYNLENYIFLKRGTVENNLKSILNTSILEKNNWKDIVKNNWKDWLYIDGIFYSSHKEYCKLVNAKTNFEKYRKIYLKIDERVKNYKERLKYLR